jgi:thiamine pyrophosphokinase
MQKVCYIIGAYHGEDAVILPSSADFVIAADGGYAAAVKLGIRPNLVVGDFDSLGYVPEAEEIVQHPVRKDDTDTLLAVRLGLERGYRNFVITGALGGRLDHSFANLQTLLFLRDHDARGVLYGDGTAATAVTGGSITISGTGTLSVFTMDPKAEGVCLRDVSFPLEGGTLTNSFPIGVSNEFVGKPATIGCNHGTLLVMWQAAKEELPHIVEML